MFSVGDVGTYARVRDSQAKAALRSLRSIAADSGDSFCFNSYAKVI